MSVADLITSFKQLVGNPLTPGSVPSPVMGCNGKEEEDDDDDDDVYIQTRTERVGRTTLSAKRKEANYSSETQYLSELI